MYLTNSVFRYRTQICIHSSSWLLWSFYDYHLPESRHTVVIKLDSTLWGCQIGRGKQANLKKSCFFFLLLFIYFTTVVFSIPTHGPGLYFEKRFDSRWFKHYSQANFKKKSDLETISTTVWSTGKDRCPESACLQLPENCHHANI